MKLEPRYNCMQSTAGCKRLQEARPLGETNLLIIGYLVPNV